METLKESVAIVRHQVVGAYLRLEVEAAAAPVALEEQLLLRVPGCEIVSMGHQLEIVKQVGSPAQLEKTYGISQRQGSHGIGHTRLSTESRVDLSHSQPFWAHGVPDLATVHNGHITNYHKLRRRYEQRGYRFYTENDSEVIGVYLRDRLAAGLTLTDALRSSLDDFDGSFSYLAASGDCLAYVKDRFGFKPLKELPGHYVRENVYFSVQYERVAIEQRHHVGVDHIMFATDFPHIENEWPNSRPIIDKIYADIPEDDKRKIWAGNAVEFFKLGN